MRMLLGLCAGVALMGLTGFAAAHAEEAAASDKKAVSAACQVDEQSGEFANKEQEEYCFWKLGGGETTSDGQKVYGANDRTPLDDEADAFAATKSVQETMRVPTSDFNGQPDWDATPGNISDAANGYGGAQEVSTGAFSNGAEHYKAAAQGAQEYLDGKVDSDRFVADDAYASGVMGARQQQPDLTKTGGVDETGFAQSFPANKPTGDVFVDGAKPVVMTPVEEASRDLKMKAVMPTQSQLKPFETPQAAKDWPGAKQQTPNPAAYANQPSPDGNQRHNPYGGNQTNPHGNSPFGAQNGSMNALQALQGLMGMKSGGGSSASGSGNPAYQASAANAQGCYYNASNVVMCPSGTAGVCQTGCATGSNGVVMCPQTCASTSPSPSTGTAGNVPDANTLYQAGLLDGQRNLAKDSRYASNTSYLNGYNAGVAQRTGDKTPNGKDASDAAVRDTCGKGLSALAGDLDFDPALVAASFKTVGELGEDDIAVLKAHLDAQQELVDMKAVFDDAKRDGMYGTVYDTARGAEDPAYRQGYLCGQDLSK